MPHGALLIRLSLLCLAACVRAADFFYRDFNGAGGLRFNGAAALSACADGGHYVYSVLDGVNDADYDDEAPDIHETSTATTKTASTRTADRPDTIANVSRYLAAFGHHEASAASPTGTCPYRLRLTPSRPSRAGSVFRVEPEPILNGFEAGFSFQITDSSLACTQVKDRDFSLRTYQTCAVSGGDGFAFVIHGDANASLALGAAASGLGYAGMRNALVIEFDTWYNAEPGVEDLLQDHVSVQASPARTGTSSGGAQQQLDAVVTEAADTRLGPLRVAALADGQLHAVKVVYWRYIKYDLLPHFAATPALLPFLVDDGVLWRLGTLAVFVDDMTAPLLALPINLNAVLQLPDDRAFVGFTASTGRAWQKHDVLDWYWCQLPGCPLLEGNPAYVTWVPGPVPT